MKNLLTILAVAGLMGGAQGLVAQQPMTHADSVRMHHAMMHRTTRRAETLHARMARTATQARHETYRCTTSSRACTAAERTRERLRMERMHAEHLRAERMRMRTRGTMMQSTPMRAGRAVGPNNPSGIGSRGTLQRQSSGLITPDAARTIALRAVPGGTSVDKIGLRTEDGRRVYDVKVITPNRTGNEQVRVDAMTGAVVQTKNVDNPAGAARHAVSSTVHRVTGH